MKAYKSAPIFDIDEFVDIDKRSTSFDMPIRYDDIFSLLVAYQKRFPRRSPKDSADGYACFFWTYASMFIFDCGRIYGIRQERARRHGASQ